MKMRRLRNAADTGEGTVAISLVDSSERENK